MLREDRFVLSHRPYAVDLASLRADEERPSGWTWMSLDAVWFRRCSGVTVARVGRLKGLLRPAPTDAAGFLTAHTDGRHERVVVAQTRS